MEWCQTKDGKYRIESLTAGTFRGALEITRIDFCQDEAVCKGTEVNKNPKAAEELLELCADAALDGVSLVAVENATGKVTAVAFNKLQVPSSSSSEKTFFEIFAEQRCTQESSKSLIKFMADVDGRCNLFKKYGVDCSLEIMFLGTARHHRQKNLGYLICETSIKLAKKLKNGPVSKITLQDLGPQYTHMPPREITTKYPKICQAIWTSQGSKKIGKNLGFNVVLTVPMTEFVYDGKTYADRIGDQNAFGEVAALCLY